MKNNIEWFLHKTEAFRDAKFKYLRRHYGARGWEMEAKFWVLNSLMGEANECWLDLTKKYELSSAASDMELTDEELQDFLMFLQTDAELLIYDVENGYTTKYVQDSFQKVAGRRDRQKKYLDKQRTLKKLEEHEPEVEQPVIINTGSIPKEEIEPVRDAIMNFFGFTETANFTSMRDIQAMMIISSKHVTWNHVRQQVQNYISLKQKTGKPHGFKNWIGTRDQYYLDGAWNSENWTKKLESHKTEGNGINGSQVKTKTKTVTFDY